MTKKRLIMKVSRYMCSSCRQVSKFKGLPTEFLRWLLTCRKCHRYTYHRLVVPNG